MSKRRKTKRTGKRHSDGVKKKLTTRQRRVVFGVSAAVLCVQLVPYVMDFIENPHFGNAVLLVTVPGICIGIVALVLKYQ